MKLEQAARQARIALQKCAHALGSYSNSDFRQRMGGIKEAESAMQFLDAVLAERAEQEPVAGAHWQVFNTGAQVAEGLTMDEAKEYLDERRFKRGWTAVYCIVVHSDDEWPNAAPVRTKDLTDDEIRKIGFEWKSNEWQIDFARAVIAADREKNK